MHQPVIDPRGEPLPPMLRARLLHYFPGLDLEAIRLYNGVPRYVRGRPRGYADRYRVYLASGWQDEADPELLALLAHELVHVQQYRDLGTWTFRWAYLQEYLAGRLRGHGHDAAYRNISFERSARVMEERVRRDFTRRRSVA